MSLERGKFVRDLIRLRSFYIATLAEVSLAIEIVSHSPSAPSQRVI